MSLAALHFQRGTLTPSDQLLAELSIQYADFALWQRDWLQGEVLEKQLAYWKSVLENAPPTLELPTDKPRPPVQSFQGMVQSKALPKNLSAALEALSQQEGVTLFTTLLTCCFCVLGMARQRSTWPLAKFPRAYESSI